MQNLNHNSNISWRRWLPWVIFCGACVQLTVQWPYLVIVPGQKANIFSGGLCAATGLCLWRLRDRTPPYRGGELIISGVLAGLVLLSGANSLTPATSLWRSAILLATCLGGFWSARLLLTSPEGGQRFQLLCSVLLAVVLVLSLVGYVTGGDVRRWFDPNRHPLPALILLLSCGPLNLLFTGAGRGRLLGGVLLTLGYLVLLLSQTLTAALLPLALGVLLVLGKPDIRRVCLPILLVLSLITVAASPWIPWQRLRWESHSLYFRLENFPFSWEIARHHPWLGNGLYAPRLSYLPDYTITYPFASLTKQYLAEQLAGFRTSDNIYLTFMADLGIPFLLMYVGAVVGLLRRLWGALQEPGNRGSIHPWALALPLVGSLLYYQVFDGLLFPQLAWFFHLLLGLIPVPEAAKRDGSGGRRADPV